MPNNDTLSRRNFVTLGGATLMSSLAAAGTGAAQPVETRRGDEGQSRAPEKKRPNIILFMPDELRADALSCYGNTVSRTPNMDALAASGTRFESCHAQYPVCGASRCSLLTGWPTSVRGHRSLFYFLRPDEPNMFRTLRQAGYDVFWFGKNDALAAQSFADSVTFWNGNRTAEGSTPLDRKHAQDGLLHPSGAPTTFLRGDTGDPKGTGDFSLIEQAIEVLDRKDNSRPFCIFLPMLSPHPPYGAPVGFQDRYSPSEITNLRPMDLKDRPSYIEGIRRDYDLQTQPLSTFQKVRAAYYGAVSYSDWMLGQLLQAVDRSGHREDTAIFLFSDHGDYAGDYGLVEKWPSGLEDCLTHVPLIARVPGGKAGHTVSNMVELYDVMASCLELAGTAPAHTNFARSLVPELRGGAGDPQRAAHAEGGYNIYEPQCFEVGYPPGTLYYPKSDLQVSEPRTISRSSMVRTAEYKLVSRPQDVSELYIYKDDPFELKNRYGDPAVASIQIEMQQRLLDWYINTTGIAPPDKDPRGLPPFYPSREKPPEATVRAILDGV